MGLYIYNSSGSLLTLILVFFNIALNSISFYKIIYNKQYKGEALIFNSHYILIWQLLFQMFWPLVQKYLYLR